MEGLTPKESKQELSKEELIKLAEANPDMFKGGKYAKASIEGLRKLGTKNKWKS